MPYPFHEFLILQTGSVCEEDIDECSSSPCINGGTCTDSLATHVCTCPFGYTGTNCELNIDECALNLCQHAVSCTDLVSSDISGRHNPLADSDDNISAVGRNSARVNLLSCLC